MIFNIALGLGLSYLGVRYIAASIQTQSEPTEATEAMTEHELALVRKMNETPTVHSVMVDASVVSGVLSAMNVPHTLTFSFDGHQCKVGGDAGEYTDAAINEIISAKDPGRGVVTRRYIEENIIRGRLDEKNEITKINYSALLVGIGSIVTASGVFLDLLESDGYVRKLLR